jgi:uncharacterized protein YuzB (UPF0349 family)
MAIRIQFCENNFQYGSEEVKSRLMEEFDEADIEVFPCLELCRECAEGPYAIVNNEIIQTDSAEELFQQLRNMIQEDM